MSLRWRAGWLIQIYKRGKRIRTCSQRHRQSPRSPSCKSPILSGRLRGKLLEALSRWQLRRCLKIINQSPHVTLVTVNPCILESEIINIILLQSNRSEFYLFLTSVCMVWLWIVGIKYIVHNCVKKFTLHKIEYGIVIFCLFFCPLTSAIFIPSQICLGIITWFYKSNFLVNLNTS